MIRAARLDHVETLVRSSGIASTQEIAQKLGVSAVTIRRDLDALAVSGRVERVFGGARIVERVPEPVIVDEPFADVLERNTEVKTRLASRAAELIADHETVFLDIGTTVYRLAEALRGRTLTVVTASLAVVDLLGEEPGIDVVLLGGEFNAQYRCTHGHAVAEALAALQIDRAMLGCAGISERGLIRDTDTRQAAVKRAALYSGANVCVLADASKFPGTGAFTAGTVEDADYVLTDLSPQKLSLTIQELLENSRTEVIAP